MGQGEIKYLKDVLGPQRKPSLDKPVYSTSDFINDLERRNAELFYKIAYPGGFLGAWEFRLVVNDEELIRQMRIYREQELYDKTITAVRAQFIPQVKPYLLEIFRSIVTGLPDPAFPTKFFDALEGAVLRLPEPAVHGRRPYDMWVELPNLHRELGDFPDYERAFHDAALLENPKGARVILPWNRGQKLKTKIPGLRYKAWKALVDGQRSYIINQKITRGPNKGQTRQRKVKFPDWASWDRTKQERLKTWGTKAPQWLLLEWGQPKWEPTITSKVNLGVKVSARVAPIVTTLTGINLQTGKVNFKNTLSGYETTEGIRPANVTIAWVELLSELWTRIVAGVWATELDKFNKLQASRNVELTYDPRVRGYRDVASGRFARLGI